MIKNPRSLHRTRFIVSFLKKTLLEYSFEFGSCMLCDGACSSITWTRSRKGYLLSELTLDYNNVVRTNFTILNNSCYMMSVGPWDLICQDLMNHHLPPGGTWTVIIPFWLASSNTVSRILQIFLQNENQHVIITSLVWIRHLFVFQNVY